MLTFLSEEYVDENVISAIFFETLEITLYYYHKSGYGDLEPMGSELDMQKNLPKIAGSILRACQTYYDTPAEQLVQIVSSITINHYLENGNKRTAVSAGVLYLISYAAFNKIKTYDVIGKVQSLKQMADAFANSGDNVDSVKAKMITYANENIFI